MVTGAMLAQVNQLKSQDDGTLPLVALLTGYPSRTSLLGAAGMASCGPNTAGFSVCYNTTTECCADNSTSMIGTYFNGGCYAKPFCKLTYTSGSFSISIVGEQFCGYLLPMPARPMLFGG